MGMIRMDTCPACGAAVEADTSVCPECGARIEGATASFAPVGTPEEAASLGMEGSDVPMLVVHKGAETGERFYLEDGEYAVGRDPASDIFLNDITVSRRHAVLTAVGGSVTVADAGSLNGTYVNDVIVDSAVLRHGDALQIGRFQMVFLAAGVA
jgi:FOG: FHA domain